MAARSSSDFASWWRATSRACCNQASASVCGVRRLPQKQLALEAIDLGFPVAFLMLVYQGEGLGQRLEALRRTVSR